MLINVVVWRRFLRHYQTKPRSFSLDYETVTVGPARSTGHVGPGTDALVMTFFCFVFGSEKADLGGVAAAKIKQLTAELDTATANGSTPFNPDERIRTGFAHFKNEKYQ